MHWKKGMFWLGVGLVDFEGLTGFLIFLLVLLALLLWGVYLLAQILIPAFLLAVLVLVVLFIPFHFWSKLTIEARARARVADCLGEIRLLESIHSPRRKVIPLERRLLEAAQALADRLFSRFRAAERSRATRRGENRELREALRSELESLSLSYELAPNRSRWSRFRRLHLERDWIRWLVEHPGGARFCVLGTLAVLTIGIASVLPR